MLLSWVCAYGHIFQQVKMSVSCYFWNNCWLGTLLSCGYSVVITAIRNTNKNTIKSSGKQLNALARVLTQAIVDTGYYTFRFQGVQILKQKNKHF